jgi:mycothiol system anti-sigma-R factor
VSLTGQPSGAHPRCDDLAERIERFIDGELDAQEVAELDAHLVECLPCVEERDLRSRIRGLVRAGCAEIAPADLVARVRARLLDMDADDEAGATHDGG